jgi:outer membrane lipoprotein-sorting protein
MKNKLLIIVFSFMTSYLFCQNLSIQEKIDVHFQNLIEIDCKYRQEKQLSMLKESLISTGTFKYQKGGEISWNQQTPFKEIFLINKVSDNKFDKHITEFIISILSGEILKDKKLSVKYLEKIDNYIVVITPVKGAMKKKIKNITLTFTKNKIKLIRLEIISHDKDITIINFSKIK